jgi:hypothetical protein
MLNLSYNGDYLGFLIYTHFEKGHLRHIIAKSAMENFYSLKNYKLVLSETVHEPGEPLVL